MFEGAGTKVLGLRGVATQPEVGGQVGEVPAAVSQEWLPGAPCSQGAARAEHENSCCDRLGTARQGVYLAPRASETTCLLGSKQMLSTPETPGPHKCIIYRICTKGVFRDLA